MDLYHSRLTPDDLNDLIIKYKIPRDLHPRLPSEDFVMSELSDNSIGIFHQMFDFSRVWIPFSSFLLVLIKHYRVHFSQLGHLGLNKVITFKELCRSLQIEPTVTLFRVFQTLCKQGDWFSFAKHCAPSLVSIDNPRPAAGSFNMADVRRLSAHEEPHLDVRSTLQRLPFFCTPPAAADAVILDPTLEDLAVGIPSSKIVAKAEASQKQKASTSGATSSHVAKRTRSALAQSSGSTTRLSLFVGNDDDDACIEISLVTPLCSAVVIPSSRNQGGSFVAPAEGSNTRDTQGKGIMVDDAAAPSVGVSQPRPSFRPAPSFRDVSGDAIHMDFFPFSAGPYYATYPEDGVAGNFESLFDDQLTTKMSVLHCMMMSHGGELLARYHGLNQSHHEYVLSTDSRMKGYEEKVANLTGLELQVATLKKQVSRLNDKLTSSDASFAKSKAKGKERKKKIKSLTKSLDNMHVEVARLSTALNQATILEAERDEEILRLKATPPDLPLVAQTDYAFLNKISEHATEPLLVILQLEPEKLVRPANVPIPRDTRVSPPIAKESTMTPASKSLELSANVVPASSAIASEQNEEQVNAAVDGSDLKMVDGAAPSKSGSHVSSGRTDVVVALSVGGKGDVLIPSSVAVEEAVVNSSRV
ncbi:hypothetical protein Tco_1056450 [Tanacetum coccineum]|uniref:Transposase (putative) gypsy type domain-containing protein n=1 Tax=Tanacetum coccineum TaxID=301880 RepID=A0ABQ5H2J5_9ASTR